MSYKAEFGGAWTLLKLDVVEKYLKAYLQVMKKQSRFELLYIDAFAGCGTIQMPQKERTHQTQTQMFTIDNASQNSNGMIEGSALRSLKLNGFTKYIFIEQDKERVQQLDCLKGQFRNADIAILEGDTNEILLKICAQLSAYNRGVLFLDPYGLSLKFSTLEAVARTRAIDVWYLFPTGNDLCRNLPRDFERLGHENAMRICNALGITENQLKDDLYPLSEQGRIFSDSKYYRQKNSRELSYYIKNRFGEIFPSVDGPLPLCNSKNGLLFDLFFMVSNPNPRAIEIARRVAKHIINSAQIG